MSLAGDVNCKQVNKYLQTGRTVKDVAETMVISESDVRKCQEQASGETKGTEGGKGEMGGSGAGAGGQTK
ncbi:MAG TPA: hypothetical protein VFD84_05955 [Candidatus Binatia bacterium]|nr:hypothetical protein [Candidatus Binatia bacterium]